MLSDRYQLGHLLGAGGMGDVWQAKDVLLNREVAVKILRPALAADDSFTARFLTEARIMAVLHHPGIVSIYDYGTEDPQTVYLVMECVEGVPLSDIIDTEGRIGVSRTLDIIGQTAKALAAAHAAGIIHRDIKPANLLLTADGTVKLADFGIARSADSTQATQTQGVFGTARYMAPEQALGHKVTPAADIYALGAVAYHCLAGQPPFDGETPVEVALHHVQDAPAPLPADIPAGVAELVAIAMAKDAAQRFPTAQAFADAIATVNTNNDATQRLASFAGVAAVPPPRDPASDTLTEMAPVSSKTPRLAIATGLILLLAGLGAFVAWGLSNSPDTVIPAPDISGTAVVSGQPSAGPTRTSTPGTRPPSTAPTTQAPTPSPTPPVTTSPPATTAAPTTPAVTTSPPAASVAPD
ncbi:serine/threonine-protein kinase [Catelliglobosispora koreensis]|uniref:serine/threonine-protein kinase n=1 Tax=Catelliglobosispora koreensis TaxID=129052 RepID=UPI000477D3BD|nr:serine/threonine-protein kinase [Catelliglobosispora koreensis]